MHCVRRGQPKNGSKKRSTPCKSWTDSVKVQLIILIIIPNIFQEFTIFSSISYQVACEALDQVKGGILHIHGNVKGNDWTTWTHQTQNEIEGILGTNWTVEQIHIENVKSFAPKVYHLVVDLKCTPNE